MKTFEQFVTEAKTTVLNDVQKGEHEAHKKWAESTPHLEGHVHEVTHGHGNTTISYIHAKHIPDVKKHLESSGFTHSSEHVGTNGREEHHHFKHPDGRHVTIKHDKAFPQNDKDTEVWSHSPLTKNAPKPGTRPGATKAARNAKQAAWNARYD